MPGTRGSFRLRQPCMGSLLARLTADRLREAARRTGTHRWAAVRSKSAPVVGSGMRTPWWRIPVTHRPLAAQPSRRGFGLGTNRHVEVTVDVLPSRRHVCRTFVRTRWIFLCMASGCSSGAGETVQMTPLTWPHGQPITMSPRRRSVHSRRWRPCSGHDRSRATRQKRVTRLGRNSSGNLVSRATTKKEKVAEPWSGTLTTCAICRASLDYLTSQWRISGSTRATSDNDAARQSSPGRITTSRSAGPATGR